MKRARELVALGLVVVALAGCSAAAQGPQPAISAESLAGAARSITVVGEGKVTLVPDLAEINIGAEATAETVSEAKAEVDGQVAAIVATLQDMGVQERDIRTTHYSIYYERVPVQVLSAPTPAEGDSGYRVSSMMRVTVRDVDKAGDLLDAAVEAGANHVYGLTFTVSDETLWQGQARARAMDDARARAAALARLAGVSLGQVLWVSEVIGGLPTAMFSGLESKQTALGELEMGTQVQVTFAIE
jgi:uncharacterized protein YggE